MTKRPRKTRLPRNKPFQPLIRKKTIQEKLQDAHNSGFTEGQSLSYDRAVQEAKKMHQPRPEYKKVLDQFVHQVSAWNVSDKGVVHIYATDLDGVCTAGGSISLLTSIVTELKRLGYGL